MQTTYSYQPRQPSDKQPKKPSRRRHVLRPLLIGIAAFLLAALGTIWIGSMMTQKNDTTETPESAKVVLPEPVLPSVILTPNAEIEAIIAANPTLMIGVGIQDATTGEHKAYGSEAPFVAASTGKLLAAAAYYDLVEKGERSLDTILGSYSAQYQIKQMINRSNNNSWELLELNIGLKNLTAYAQSIGVSYVTVGNTIVPGSMASFLSELYNGNILNEEHTQEMLSYMQDTNWETLIPPVVPEGVTIYHKYGLLNDVVHDVAILKKGDKVFTLAIYTAGADYNSMGARSEALQAIATAAIKQMFSEEQLAQ